MTKWLLLCLSLLTLGAAGRMTYLQVVLPYGNSLIAWGCIAAETLLSGVFVLLSARAYAQEQDVMSDARDVQALLDGLTELADGLAHSRPEIRDVYARDSTSLQVLRDAGEALRSHVSRLEEASQALDELVAPDPEKSLAQRIRDEFHDFQMLIEHCETVYVHFSRDRISKPQTLPSEVITLAEDFATEDINEAVREETEELRGQVEGLTATLAEKDARIIQLETSVDYLRDVCDHLPQPKVEAEEPVSPRPPATSGRQVDFNINEFVRVKITDAGWRALWKADDTLNEHLKTTKASWRSQRTERLRDEQQRQGYTRWQLWSLMEAFGSAICLGCDVPFEPTITLLLPNWTEPPAAVQARPAPAPSREPTA